MTTGKKFSMTKGFLVRAIKALEQRELIVRRGDYIIITAKGKALMKASARKKQ